MHVMRGCPEAAERHGAGHVARCTARGAHGRPGPARHPSRQVPARRKSSTRPTSAKAFRPFRPNELWVADVPRKAGGAPFYIHIFFVWGYVAFVTDVHSRRFLGRQNQLPAIVHRSSPGCPPDGRLATNTSGCRSLWPGASTCGYGVPYRPIRYGQALSDSDAVELAAAEWIHWRGHHPATLRHRHANPHRVRNCLGPRRQPEQPVSITTSHHRHQTSPSA